jgi:hypothetical protein
MSVLEFVKQNNIHGLKEYIEHGGQVNRNAFEVLSYTLENNQKDVLRFLISAGINVNIVNPEHVLRSSYDAEDTKGSNILSTVFADVNLLSMLIKAGADVRFDDSAPVIDAAKADRTNVVTLYLQYGANPNAHGGQPLMWAIINQNLVMVKILLAYGARITDDIIALARANPQSSLLADLQKQTQVVPYNRHLVSIKFRTTSEFLERPEIQLKKAGYHIRDNTVTNPLTNFRIYLTQSGVLEGDISNILNALQELGVAPLTTSVNNGIYAVDLDMERNWSKFIPTDETFVKVSGWEHFEPLGEISFDIGVKYPSLFTEGVIQPFDRYRDIHWSNHTRSQSQFRMAIW